MGEEGWKMFGAGLELGCDNCRYRIAVTVISPLAGHRYRAVTVIPPLPLTAVKLSPVIQPGPLSSVTVVSRYR
eukprot:gene13983-biopygen4001